MFKILDDWKILVVSQSDANHQRIAALLAALRSAKAVRNKSLPSTKKTDPTDDFELRVYSIERLANGDTPLAAAQAIESVIRETIARDSWSDRRALIKALPNRIVVRQQLAVHEEISDLLDQIAKPGGDELIEVVSN